MFFTFTRHARLQFCSLEIYKMLTGNHKIFFYPMTIQFGTRNNYEWDMNQRKLALFHKEYSIESTSKYFMILTIFISIGYILNE